MSREEMMHHSLATPSMGFSGDARGGVLLRSSWRGSPVKLAAGFFGEESCYAAALSVGSSFCCFFGRIFFREERHVSVYGGKGSGDIIPEGRSARPLAKSPSITCLGTAAPLNLLINPVMEKIINYLYLFSKDRVAKPETMGLVLSRICYTRL
jgi:hypothetical protein